MTQPFHRRGFFRRLVAALLGAGAAHAAAAPKTPALSPTPRAADSDSGLVVSSASGLVVYAASGLPPGIRINANTGVITGHFGRKKVTLYATSCAH